ncbi:HYC_CC_PP family protein [Sediminicola sp. 1XM1-17]|uniref:HYC_CC_PP family protein n=1 Tax=Sediminicola sp. 1XM1-17 TaxID=3127702 RepID=UPI0030786D7A
MMKAKIRHILSFAMAFLVLFSTLSFTVDMHFCGKQLVDFGLYKSAKTCGMATMNTTMGDQMDMDMGCCSDFNLVQQGQDDWKINLENISFGNHYFIATFISNYIELFQELNKIAPPNAEYPPPLLVQDVIILDQQFLI